MLCFLKEITKWIDEGSPVDIVYLDIQKAFNKVPHQRLLLILKAHSIEDGIINWIEKWLTDRRLVSNWKSVLSGVPQGSVLGPLLPMMVIKQLLQNDLDKLVKWSKKWQMLCNIGKCKCLHTEHGNLDVNYKMGDTILGTTIKENNLEVTISAEMKVSEQLVLQLQSFRAVGIAASKGNHILGLIRRNITYKKKAHFTSIKQ